MEKLNLGFLASSLFSKLFNGSINLYLICTEGKINNTKNTSRNKVLILSLVVWPLIIKKQENTKKIKAEIVKG